MLRKDLTTFVKNAEPLIGGVIMNTNEFLKATEDVAYITCSGMEWNLKGLGLG